MRWSCVLLLVSTSVASRLCERAYNSVQREMHRERMRRVLNPIQDGALMLSLESTSDGDTLLAHRLLRVHDNYTAACHHHQWHSSLTHKLCASFKRWQAHIESECAARPLYHTGRFYRCTCTGLQEVLTACTHHVLPQASDNGLCTSLREQDCLDIHPFGGLCQLASPRQATQSTEAPHVRFRTREKHSHWMRFKARSEVEEVTSQMLSPLRQNKLDRRHKK